MSVHSVYKSRSIWGLGKGATVLLFGLFGLVLLESLTGGVKRAYNDTQGDEGCTGGRSDLRNGKRSHDLSRRRGRTRDK